MSNTVTPAATAPLKRRQPSQPAPGASAAASDKSEIHDEDRDKASRILRYGSVIPCVGGGFEAVYGVKELHKATELKEAGDPAAAMKKSDGRVDVIRGSSALLAGVCHLPMYAQQYLPALVHMSHPVFAALGLIGGIGSAVNCVFDGGRDVYNGIKYGHKSDIGWGAVKLAAGALEVTGSVTLNVPLMMLANVIFAGAAAGQNRHALAKAAHKVAHLVAAGYHKIVPGHDAQALPEAAEQPQTSIEPSHAQRPTATSE